MKYQLQYANQSKTHTSNIETANYQNARNLFDDLFDGELLEIREFQHENKTIKKDDGNYIKYASIFYRGENGVYSSFKIPKLKKTVTDSFLLELFSKSVKINGKKPLSARITTKN